MRFVEFIPKNCKVCGRVTCFIVLVDDEGLIVYRCIECGTG